MKKKETVFDPEHLRIAKEYFDKNKVLSVPYLMRKLNVSHAHATKILDKILFG